MRLLAMALLGSVATPAQPLGADPAEARLHHDWAWLGRYADDRPAPTPGRPRIVFLGASITENWATLDPGFFTPGRIGRGIGGQTTPQLLLRFRQDVLDLHPAAVHILAGTNDVAGNTGSTTDAQIHNNVRSMAELALAHGVRVILGAIPPAERLPWRPDLAPGARIRGLNAWLRAYAARIGATYADYWTALGGGGLGPQPGLTSDGVHPTPAGYRVMDRVADAAIRAALARPAPPPIPAARRGAGA